MPVPTWLDYAGKAQEQDIARQQQQQQAWVFQQQKAQYLQQQNAAQAAGNALPKLLQPPPQQAPAPGQPSQPMQQPQSPMGVPPQVPPMQAPQQQPGQQPQPGQVNLPPLPPGGPQGSMPPPGAPPLPPFKPMPTSPPPQQAQGGPASIPAPPQAPQQPQATGGPLTLENAIKVLQDQGLSGADLMAGLQQLQPVLDSASKAQAAQLEQSFNNQLKIQAVQDRHDSLQERIEEAKQRSQDRSLDRDARMQAHQDSVGLQSEALKFRMQEATLKHQADPDAKLDPEDVKFLAQQAMAGDTSVYQNLGRGVQGAQNIVAIRKAVAKMQQDAGGTGADQAAANVAFQGEKAGARTAGNKTANVEMAVNEAQKTGQIAQDLSDKIPRTKFVPLNKALQAAESNTGDPDIVAFGAANNTFINTYARAISPTGTPTVHDKEHAREILSAAQTPEQYKAVMGVLQKEMQAARSSPGDVQAAQKARIAGKPQGGTANAPSIPSGWSVVEH